MLFSRVHFKTAKKSDDEDTDPSLLKKNVVLKQDRRLSKDYVIGEYLGSGKFGEVKRCEEKQTGGQFAAKFVPIASDEDWESVQNEIAIMNRLRHPRLIQLYDAYSHKSEVIMVLELITGGELFERIIDESFDLNESRCIRFMNEILQGVEYIHNQGVLHLDLKPENILCLSKTSFKIKIIDFGLARFYDGKEMCVLFGTPEFVSPEVISYEPVGPPADMWSVGVICYVMLSGLSPFMGDSQGETLANIIKVTYDFDYPEFDEISEEARDFIRKLLLKDPRKRMTATECLQHPWIKKKRQLKRKGTVSKKRLKHFVYRRKWQKAVNAIIALLRMGVVLHHPYQPDESQVDSPASDRASVQLSATAASPSNPPVKQVSVKRDDQRTSESPQSPKVKTRRTSFKSMNNALFSRITSKRNQSPASRKTSVKEDDVNLSNSRASPKPTGIGSRRPSILNKFSRGGTPNSGKSKTTGPTNAVTVKDSTSPSQVKFADQKSVSGSKVTTSVDSKQSQKLASDINVQPGSSETPSKSNPTAQNQNGQDSSKTSSISTAKSGPNSSGTPGETSKTVPSMSTTNKVTKTGEKDLLMKSTHEPSWKSTSKMTSTVDVKRTNVKPITPKPPQKKVLPLGSSIATRIGFFSSLSEKTDKKS